MKVLFAVSNESISESIVKKYQKEYKEIVSYKNVYYFNAILKEIQRDKSYDRIVISEDLEPFANNDYEAIERFIFEKLDSISDEATDMQGGDTPIILICSDRRTKGEQLLVKLFGIGIYNAILGQDRSIDEVCKLIRKPRTKKEAKNYYRIESEDVNYQAETEDNVSEIEIQNILAHYKRLGKDDEAYVESFNNIAAQYSEAQLRIISKFLPLNVRAVLETQSPKYQSIMSFATPVGQKAKKEEKREDGIKINFIENQLNKPKLSKPVIVPSAMNTTKVKKMNKKEDAIPAPIVEQKPKQETTKSQQLGVNLFDLDEEEEQVESVVAPKKGRGRPKKAVEEASKQEEVPMTTPKRGRGRPKKVVEEPLKQEEPQNLGVNLFDLDEEEKEDTTMLPGFDEMDDTQEIPSPNSTRLPGFDEEEEQSYQPRYETNNNFFEPEQQVNQIQHQSMPYQNVNIENLLTRDKKIVSFVGTTKNGTSFLINNLAELFSSMGINTAILDATKNKNSYFIYTKNEEQLRKVAFDCMENLEQGIPQGISVNKNLTVYTSLPTESEQVDYEAVLSTLVKNYSLILIDCDFNTPIEYFENSQEIYLVQSMDILTIQPLTAFLRDLKAKNVLVPEKIRIVVNKQTRIRSLNTKVIIGGMAFYNDPSMSFMTELFNKDNVKYCTIPFDEQVYSKYLEGLVNCKISLNGYPKNFMTTLKELGNMVYPLLNNKYTAPVSNNYEKKSAFSSNMNDTLQQMKNRY